jgi:uncharacterized protein Yka (UPF0111/DUF47 family)
MFGGSRKDELFYKAFKDQAQIAVEAADKFLALLGDPASAERMAAGIAEDEKREETIRRRAVRELHATWITPLDRHHIHELVLALERIVELVGSTAMRVVLFRIREVRPEATDLARDLRRALERVRAVTELLPKLSKKNGDEIMCASGEIHAIEGHADEIYRRALAALFDGGTDPLAVMKWREILDNLEAATDLARDIAKLFEAIVLENA